MRDFIQKWDNFLPEDRQYGKKILLSGAENKSLRDGLAKIGIKHIALSYYYLRKYLTTTTKEDLQADLSRFSFVFLHSGAYTLKKQLKHPNTDLINSYAKEYYTVIKDINDLFAVICDIDIKVTADISELPPNLVPIISGAPLKEYEDLGWFDKYPYIAVSREVIKSGGTYLKDIFKLGKAKDILFHGLGSSSQFALKQPFYSIDSASWIHGGKFGKTSVFQKGKLFHYDKDNKFERKRFKNKFEAAGLSWVNISNDNPLEINLMNALAWKELEEYYQYNIKQNYWITSDEKADILECNKKVLQVSAKGEEIIKVDAALSTDLENPIHEKLQCDSCYISDKCKKFSAGADCSYNLGIELNNAADFAIALKNVLELEYQRVLTGAVFERAEGGVLDKKVSTEMTNLFQMMKDMKEILSPKSEKLTIHAEGGSGTVSEMLKELFKPNSDVKPPIDVTPKKD